MSNQLNPINIIFEDDLSSERMAEFIQILSELYGESLDVISVKDLPPMLKMREAS